MTTLIRGEIIKAISTRTLLAFTATAILLAIVNVLVVTQFSDLDKVSDKQDALAGMPILLLLLGLVGAAASTAIGRRPPQRSSRGAIGARCCSPARGHTR